MATIGSAPQTAPVKNSSPEAGRHQVLLLGVCPKSLKRAQDFGQQLLCGGDSGISTLWSPI